jgi:hypothetical protein
MLRQLYPRERPRPQFVGVWVGPWASQDMCGKSRFDRDFFLCSLVLCSYFNLTCFLSLLSCFLPFCLYLQHRHPCPGGIQTPNPRKPLAADLRFRPFGHLEFDRRTVQPVASLYTDWAIPVHTAVLCNCIVTRSVFGNTLLHSTRTVSRLPVSPCIQSIIRPVFYQGTSSSP